MEEGWFDQSTVSETDHLAKRQTSPGDLLTAPTLIKTHEMCHHEVVVFANNLSHF